MNAVGVAAGVSLGIIGVFQRMEDKYYKLISARLEEEVKEHNETRKLLKRYRDKYGEIEVE